jgi:hypothetical protein
VFNPFWGPKGIRFPDTLAEIDELKARMMQHVAETTVRYHGLADIAEAIGDLEHWRREVEKKGNAPLAATGRDPSVRH